MIDVFVAEDQNLVRGALVALLNLEEGIRVVGETDRGDRVVDDVLRLSPGVAVLDVNLPGMDGLSAAAQLRHSAPDVRVLILTSMGTAGGFRRAVDAGVHGFLVKDAPAYQLADAVRAVVRGERVVDVELAADAGDPLEQPSGPVGGPGGSGGSGGSGGPPPRDCPLSPRELSVLTAIAAGATMSEIGSSLGLSAGTVRTYLMTIASKTRAKDSADAVRVAVDRGWI